MAYYYIIEFNIMTIYDYQMSPKRYKMNNINNYLDPILKIINSAVIFICVIFKSNGARTIKDYKKAIFLIEIEMTIFRNFLPK